MERGRAESDRVGRTGKGRVRTRRNGHESLSSLRIQNPVLGGRIASAESSGLDRVLQDWRSRAISGDLGAAPRYLGRSRSVARAASHLLKKEGPGWSHGAHEDVLARFSPPRPAPLGPVRRRPARRVPRPVHADPCAHRSSSALLGLLSRSRRGTRRDSLPPTSDGLGRFCAPWRLCMSRVPACQGWCQGQFNCQGWCQGQLNCLAGAKAQRLSSLSLLPLHPLNFLPLSPLRLSLLFSFFYGFTKQNSSQLRKLKRAGWKH